MLEDQLELLRRVTTAIGSNLDHDRMEAYLQEGDLDSIEEVSWRDPGVIRIEGTRGDKLMDITLRVESIVIGAQE